MQMMESDEEDEGDAEFAVEISKQELVRTLNQSFIISTFKVNAIRGMAAKLENLQTCNDLIVKHGHALQVRDDIRTKKTFQFGHCPN